MTFIPSIWINFAPMQEIFNYTTSFGELLLKPADLLNNSGQFNPEQQAELIDFAKTAFDIGGSLAEINACIVLIGVEIQDDGVFTPICKLLPGRKITSLFKNATKGAFFLCTAGKKIEEASHNLMAQGKLIEGYFLDLLGSLTVEKAMDQFQEEFTKQMHNRGCSVSNRYSPGYCDWQVADQHQLFRLFEPGCCGITLSQSALMSPVKSVSGMMGVGKMVKYHEHHCDHCQSNTCIYRAIKNKKTT